MKIAMLAASMSRNAGGVAHAVRSLGRRLVCNGAQVTVFAGLDEYSAEDAPLWSPMGLHLGRVTGPAAWGFQPGLGKAISAFDPDIVHLHGLWMYPSLAARHGAGDLRPRVISPHGMLDPWALRNSAWKKRIAAFAFERRNLQGAACIHALCAAERDAIRSYGITSPIAVIPNGIEPVAEAGSLPAPVWADRIAPGGKVLLFLGRIHPKKGIGPLIGAMDMAGRDCPGWHVVIAGWDDGGHQADVQRMVVDRGLVSRVHFVGPLHGPQKDAALAVADAFILPSISEGLPMAVLEAWSFARPVLMTDACNLPEGFEAGAALRIGADQAGIARGLREVARMPEERRAEMGRRGRLLVETRFSLDRIAAEMQSLYGWVSGKAAMPDFVDAGHG